MTGTHYRLIVQEMGGVMIVECERHIYGPGSFEMDIKPWNPAKERKPNFKRENSVHVKAPNILKLQKKKNDEWVTIDSWQPDKRLDITAHWGKP